MHFHLTQKYTNNQKYTTHAQKKHNESYYALISLHIYDFAAMST